MRTSEDFQPATQEGEMLKAMLCNLEHLNLQVAELVEARGGGDNGKVVASASPPVRRQRRPRKAVKIHG